MGGIIPPIIALICKTMKKHKTNSRACLASPDFHSPSRPRDIMDTPLWLLLYWLDLSIVSEGYFARRRLLRLRNFLLSFLSVPSGSAWYVSPNPKQGKVNNG